MLSGAVLGQSQERAGLVLGEILGLVFPALAAPSFSVCFGLLFSTLEGICQFKCGFDHCKSSPCTSAGFGFVLPTWL